TDDRTVSTDWHPPVTSPGEIAYREFPYAGLPPTHVRKPQRSRSRSRGDSRQWSPSQHGIKSVDTDSALWSSLRLIAKTLAEIHRRSAPDAADHHGASCEQNADRNHTRE
ncbi:hypothetical protein LTR95_019652, partial [Oleoguttula sp. CCFEE 5521]